MKSLLLTLMITHSILGQAKITPDFYTHSIKSSNAKEINLKQYKGKIALLVNIATRCGYTGQLDGLEKLYKKYSNDLIVIGIPSNDFGSQTPEGDKKVATFCRLKYGVTFPITKKVVVTGQSKHPLIKHIVKSSDGKKIKWNFEKFLFDQNGKFVKRFPSSIEPESKIMNEYIKNLIN